ncbi:peptide ABC transporter substrate-binding protein [Ramlibacter albus]|uniref:Peptide ABC transporter substrate-binding protein n=1 Tax=Ramlibacter albus TaxID=2079448 RepID=A0A923S175_9BURK|nr:peptide ABC transporter substrate-binding protein [Ramlibacter albus]MBC5763986.1 peptide ABC transporter substrate-binding protein [Ramlibacter albus]
MDENKLRGWIEDVREGRMPRRRFVERLVSLGLTAPIAGQLLMHAGVANSQTAFNYKPTKRGGGGQLKLLMWQGPTLLNPYFGTGAKDQVGSRAFYEPLAQWDNDANLVPVLAAEIPTRENGGVAADGKSVTWKLKRGVTWHDGKPFTADDVVFNWEYARDPAAASVSMTVYAEIKVEKVDSHTVRLVFDKPRPFWAQAFVAAGAGIIPKHHFAAYMGAKSRDAPANLKPVGTGPYRIVDFKPGDLVRAEAYPGYHMPNRPHFDSLEIKGGGDPTSAARAVLQTGEYDWAWNMQMEDEVLKRFEAERKGHSIITVAPDVEFVYLNVSDPWTEVDGERASPKSKHFAFGDTSVRQAMALLMDRESIQQYIYGRTGAVTANWINAPARYASKNTKPEFDIDKAQRMLEAAGWKKGGDGVREKGGRKMKFVFQTSTNPVRQKVQTVIKQACQKAGIDLELKSVSASVFFSSDVANPDTNTKFWADLEMFAVTGASPDPLRSLDRYVSWEIASKVNKWQGRNLTRWHSDEYDKLYRAAEFELDPVKRAAMFIRMNDIVVNEAVVIPLIRRSTVSVAKSKMVTRASAWDTDFWALQDWYREA